MKRLVIALPDAICVGCGVRELPSLRYAHGGAPGDPPGSISVGIGPPPRWAELKPDQVPERQIPRTFLICPACYDRGAAHGSTPTTAHLEEPR